MAIALTIDQRSSRTGGNRVDEWVSELNARYDDMLEQRFVAVVGDEMQALARDTTVVVDCVVRGIRYREWWVGIGVGAVEQPLGPTAARSEGPAFYNAREAVDRAKGQSYGYELVASNAEQEEDLRTVLNAVGYIAARRGPADSKRWQAVDLAAQGMRVGKIGDRLGIKSPSVSERLNTAGWREEQSLRALFARLAGMVSYD
jgi:hypothetical protein